MNNEKKNLIVDSEFVTRGLLVDAICQVQIYEMISRKREKKYKVILSKPKREKYLGKSVTNHFEIFATKIKEKYLSSIDESQIEWCHFSEWESEGYENFYSLVKLDFDGQTYKNPSWIGMNS